MQQLFDRIRTIGDTAHELKQFPGKWHFTYEGQRYEIDSTLNLSNDILRSYREDFIAGVTETPIDRGVYFINLATCYAFKRSHAGVPIHVDKTLSDLIMISKEFMGETEEVNAYEFLNPRQKLLLTTLKVEAEERDKVRKKRINFNKPKEEFFKPAEHLRLYEHDKIHDVTCRWRTLGPLYRDNLVDPAKALIDMEKFANRDLDYRLTMAQEEAMVIGIERFYLNNRKLSAQTTYKLGMTKLIATLSKGRFQDFMLDHIHLLSKPKWDYLERFIIAEQNGAFSERIN